MISEKLKFMDAIGFDRKVDAADLYDALSRLQAQSIINRVVTEDKGFSIVWGGDTQGLAPNKDLPDTHSRRLTTANYVNNGTQDIIYLAADSRAVDKLKPEFKDKWFDATAQSLVELYTRARLDTAPQAPKTQAKYPFGMSPL